MIDDVVSTISNVSNIRGDYGAQVEGRKLASEFLVLLKNVMIAKERQYEFDKDNFE